MKIALLASRNLTRNRRRTTLALLTIAVGMGAIICLNGFVAGFLKIMVDSQVRSRLGDLQITAINKDNMQVNDPKLRELTQIVGVESISQRLHFAARAKRDGIEVSIVGIGVVPSAENRVCPQAALEIENGGRYLNDQDTGRILASSDLIESLGLNATTEDTHNTAVGNTLGLVTDTSTEEHNVIIKGVQRTLFAFDSRGYLLTTLTTAQNIAGRRNTISEVAIRILDGHDQDKVKKTIEGHLGDRFKVKGWRELMPFLNEAVGRSQAVLDVICLILLIIVSFGIANTMQMNVNERKREIGTLAAIGFSARQIATLFLTEAVVLGFVGGILGLLLGLSVTTFFRLYGIELPKLAVLGVKILRPEWPVIAILPTLLATMLSALMAGVIPALRAARLNPIEALRAM